MPCGGCGKKNASLARFSSPNVQRSARPVQAQRSIQAPAPTEEWPQVVYVGASANHYIVSPKRKVKHYGYSGRGARIRVHPEDVRAKPGMFIPISIVEAQKVWPDYPAGVPVEITSVLGNPTTEETDTPDEELPFSDELVEYKASTPDPTLMTVTAIKELEGLSVAQWKEVIMAEKAGKARVTVINYIEDVLEHLP